jgi:hypothetical protein
MPLRRVKSAPPRDGSADRRRGPLLPKRDWFLLPAIFLGTILLILVGGEVSARVAFPQADSAEPCEHLTPDGYRYQPFCTSHTKVWEGPWVTQHFNACGYRTAESCGPRPPGSLRVVVMGSSTARGALVNYQDSFAARASKVLSADCGGLVDFQNLGTEPPDVGRLDQRIPEALGLKPSAIVIAIGPFDIGHLLDKPPQPGKQPRPKPFDLHTIVGMLRESRLFLLMQYELYRDPGFQVRSFLLNGDVAGYVRTPLSPAWRARVAGIDALLGRIAAQTRAAGVPVMLVYVPERAQVAMATGRYRLPADVDPYALQKALAAAAAAHGVTFVDSTPEFLQAKHFNRLFYLTDGHPQAGGHAAIARAVEKALLAQPAFRACRPEAQS